MQQKKSRRSHNSRQVGPKKHVSKAILNRPSTTPAKSEHELVKDKPTSQSAENIQPEQTIAWHSKSNNLNTYEQKSAIRFLSQRDLEYFIDMLWGEEDLYNIPRVPVGDHTMIVPTVAVERIRHKLGKKHPFIVEGVINPRDLSAKDFADLQKERTSQ